MGCRPVATQKHTLGDNTKHTLGGNTRPLATQKHTPGGNTKTRQVLNVLNNLTHSMLFTLEEVLENKFNCLDNTVPKNDNNIQFSIYVENPVQQMS
jgi:hypothetical protein